jgi:hypothetical protein
VGAGHGAGNRRAASRKGTAGSRARTRFRSGLTSNAHPGESGSPALSRVVPPIVAARKLADVGDVTRFVDRNRFASWTGTAPIEASSGEQVRNRLS